MRRYLPLAVVVLVLLLAGCGSPTGDGVLPATPTPAPDDTPVDATDETPTPEPGATPTVAADRTPTRRSDPDATPTPEPGVTQTPGPDQTVTAGPDRTAGPDQTPSPEAEATQTPEPGATPTPRPGAPPTPEPGTDDEIDDCSTIDEPGEYELTADLEDREEAVCIRITASDVVVDGGDNLVEGVGDNESVGIHVTGAEANTSAENVTIRNLQVERWGDGIQTGTEPGQTGEVTLENVAASDNEASGVLLRWGGSPAMESVTANGNGRTGIFSFEGTVGDLEDVEANGNGDSGITLWEEDDVSAEGIEVSENANHGLDLWDNVLDSEFADVTATANGGAGVNTGIDVHQNTFSKLSVADNQDAGIDLSDSGANTFQDAVVENNGGTGILVKFSSDQSLENVTVRENGNWQVDAGTGGSVSATALEIGDDATFDFAEEQVALDAVPEDDLPGLPDDAEAVGDGVEVDGIQDSATATLQYDADRVSGDEVELWRHDGTEWTVEETADVNGTDGTITADLIDDGVYAPVDSEEE